LRTKISRLENTNLKNRKYFIEVEKGEKVENAQNFSQFKIIIFALLPQIQKDL